MSFNFNSHNFFPDKRILLVSGHGYPIGYQIFEGNTCETKTRIPVLEAFQSKFGIDKPIVLADAALLSLKNIEALSTKGYEFIHGGRLKNETEAVKAKVIQLNIEEGKPKEFTAKTGRLIVSFSSKQASVDNKNGEKVIENYSQLWNIEKAFRISKTV